MSRASSGGRFSRPNLIHREPSAPPMWLMLLGGAGLVAFAVVAVWYFAIIDAYLHRLGY